MTISPGKDNLTIYKNGVLSEFYTVEDEDDAGNIIGTVDLTGYTARAQAREDYDSADPFMDLTTENGGITLGGAAGTISLFMAATATDDITATCGVWDLVLIPPSGEAHAFPLLKGNVCVKPGATQ